LSASPSVSSACRIFGAARLRSASTAPAWCRSRCDSDLQEAALGEALEDAEIDDLRRGDLIFWKGHVAIVRDHDTLVHANAFHMQVAIEPIAVANERILASGTDIISVRRLFEPPIDPAFIV
jgi:hypothetical protein